MNRTIWKYEIPLQDDITLEMPRGMIPLTVATQLGKICLWAEVDPSQPKEPHHFRLAGTGHPLPEGVRVDYIGTVFVQGGYLVFHLYQKGGA